MALHRDHFKIGKPVTVAALLVAGAIAAGAFTAEPAGGGNGMQPEPIVLAQTKAEKAAAVKAAKAAKEAAPKAAETGTCPPGKSLVPPRGRDGKPACI